jgi:hypothetical protein
VGLTDPCRACTRALAGFEDGMGARACNDVGGRSSGHFIDHLRLNFRSLMVTASMSLRAFSESYSA